MVYKIKFSLSKRNAIKMVHHLFQVRQAQKTHLNFFSLCRCVLFAFINHFFLFLFSWCSFRTTPKKKRRRKKFTKKRQLNFEFEHMKKKRRQSTNTIKPNNNSNAEKKNMMNFYIFFQIFVVCFCYFVPVFLIESHFVLSLFYLHLGVSINNICFRFARFFLFSFVNWLF